MNEEEIIKYLNAQSTSAEAEAVENWILAEKENADTFFEIERLWTMPVPTGQKQPINACPVY